MLVCIDFSKWCRSVRLIGQTKRVLYMFLFCAVSRPLVVTLCDGVRCNIQEQTAERFYHWPRTTNRLIKLQQTLLQHLISTTLSGTLNSLRLFHAIFMSFCTSRSHFPLTYSAAHQLLYSSRSDVNDMQ